MPEREAFEPEDTGTAGLLSATYHFMMGRILDELIYEGYRDLSKTQLHVLARFGTGEMTLAEISDRVQIPVQVVANITHMLSTSGYLTHVSESSALGTASYAVSERGHAALTIVDQGQKAVERGWVDQLGEQEVRRIIDSLSSLFQASIRVAEG